MPVYADNSIPANLRKTRADGFSRVDSVASCNALFLIRDGATVREMTDAEKAQYYPQETMMDADCAKAELFARDAEGADIRLIEDIVDALSAVIVLPEAAAKRLAERKAIRDRIRGTA